MGGGGAESDTDFLVLLPQLDQRKVIVACKHNLKILAVINTPTDVLSDYQPFDISEAKAALKPANSDHHSTFNPVDYLSDSVEICSGKVKGGLRLEEWFDICKRKMKGKGRLLNTTHSDAHSFAKSAGRNVQLCPKRIKNKGIP